MADVPKLYKDADSRLKGYFGQVTHATLPLQRTYCVKCGAPAGYCSMESSKFVSPGHIVVTCNDCDIEMAMSGATPVPQNMLDAFGMVCDPPEAEGKKEKSDVLV